jgi:hypothetical protein
LLPAAAQAAGRVDAGDIGDKREPWTHMGAVFFSIDRKLIETIQNVLHARTFVETGTFEGDSVARIEDLFETVLTVECSREYYDASSRRFQGRENIHVALGDSPGFLKDVREQAGDSAIFWLDAHWCLAESTSGEQSQCPLLAELEAIGNVGAGSVILIDDARLFMAAPPKPHEITHWPTLSQVMQRLTKLSADHSLMIVNDVIVFYPPALEGSLRAYAHQHSVDWLHILHQSREYEVILESLGGKDAAILEKETALTVLTQDLESKDRSLAQKDAEIESKDAALFRLAAELVQKDNSIKEKDAALRQAHAASEAFRTGLSEKDRALQAANAASEVLRAELLAKDEALGRALAAAGELHAAVLEKDEALQEAQALGQALNEQLLAKDTTLAEANDFLATFQNDLVAKEHEIQNAHRLLDEMRDATQGHRS